MSTTERREREKSALKNAILREAEKIICERGYENLTIRSLAQNIEYSPRTLYLYFKDKREILSEIVEDGFRTTWESIETEKDRLALLSPREILAHQIRSHMNMALCDPERYRVVIMILSSPEFSRGPYQEKVELEVRKTIQNYLTPPSEEQLDALCDIFLSSLRGLTRHLVQNIRAMSPEALELRISMASMVLLNGLEIEKHPQHRNKEDTYAGRGNS